MAKYKIGDRVRLMSKRPDDIMFVEPMAKYLGKVLTVSEVEETPLKGTIYRFREAQYEGVALSMYRLLGLGTGSWNFKEDWISGLASGKKSVNYPGSGYKVVLHFIGKTTTATLMHGDRAVKTAEAKCSPADQFQYGEGAKIAVERLFEKKRPVANIEEKFVITKESLFHCFKRGQIVRLVHRDGCISRYKDEKGTLQYVPDAHVRPYKEEKR